MIQIHHVESVFDCARTLHASPFSSVHQLFGQLLSIILAPVVLWQGEVFDANCFPRVTFLFGMLPFWCALCFGNVRFQHIFAPPTHESSAMHLTFARFCHVKYIPLHHSPTPSVAWSVAWFLVPTLLGCSHSARKYLARHCLCPLIIPCVFFIYDVSAPPSALLCLFFVSS